ncbi:hypothetical protein BDN71DRAFT_1506194 [Pleurotus eryngii]|uniref:Uncharacterized protein n=1 Tax=Pleurotus eryngii TaxID=5323 RepID=A0A9P6A0K5_PLEER|nr:hypothetical protein BDN71DRAFT_1506194 [Pleurotus eryngii]
MPAFAAVSQPFSGPMPNPTGKNQYQQQQYPSEDELWAALNLYAREKNGARLSTKEQQAWLKKEFGLSLGQGIPQVPLSSLSLMHQVHCDGYEKLNSQALGMGTVTLSIYGFKDQFSSFILALKVLPDVRNVETVCHLYLDMVEEYQSVPLQLVMDKGSEIDDMVHAQTYLCLQAAPEFAEEQWPATL